MNAITTKDIARFATTSVLCFVLVTAAQFLLATFTGSHFEPNWAMNVVMSLAGAFGEYIGIQRRLKKA